MQMPDNDVTVQMSTVNYAAANLDCFLVYAGASELRLFWEISRQSKNFSEMSAFSNYPMRATHRTQDFDIFTTVLFCPLTNIDP